MTYREIKKCLDASINGVYENICAIKIKNIEMYRDIFSTMPLEKKQGKKDKYEQGEYVLIATMINYDKNTNQKRVKKRLIFDGLDELDKIIKKNEYDNNFLGCISYAGQNATRKNARYMYALVIDLDNLTKSKKNESPYYNNGISMLDYYISREWLWTPNYVVVSGHGLHLYYCFEKPISLYQNNLNLMYDLKKKMIDRIWNEDVVIKESTRQYGNSIQYFRIAGTKTKIKGLNTQAYKLNKEKFTPYILAQRTLMKEKEKEQYKDMVDFNRISLVEAKRLYPEWYQKRIVEKKKPKKWNIKRDLYDWYLREIKMKAATSHRYYCCLNLVSYAQKCDIPYEELEKDLYELLPILDERTVDETNHFTTRDIKDALSCYNNKIWNYKKVYMEQKSGFEFPKNKRNYRKQKDHIKYMNVIKQFKIENGECNKLGRKSKDEKVIQYLKNNENRKIKDIMQNCNVSKHTAIKYRRLYQNMI